MKISVTTDDIENGAQGIVNSCAVARAIQRETGLYEVWVDDESIRCLDERCTIIKEWKTPKSVVDFIEVFDTDQSAAEPFEFEL